MIVEDFRAEGGTARSSDWYRKLSEELLTGDALTEATDLATLLAKIEPPDAHEHPLHSSTAIAAAIERRFAVTATDSAYYFRYVEPHLREEGVADWLLDIELEQQKQRNSST